MNESTQLEMYLKISKAICYISLHKLEQPNLCDIAHAIGMSDFYLQRLFSDWVGLSPKQFLKFQTQQYAKQCLQQSSVLQSAIDSGLSGSGRLHDLMLTCEGMTPGEYKKQGEGVEIFYGIHDSPFGLCLVASTERGICKVSFFDEESESGLHVRELFQEWPHAHFTRQEDRTASIVAKIFERSLGKNQSLNLLLKGSPFQIQVWRALLSIPESRLTSYQQVANKLGSPNSVRAVASAIAKNKLAYLIPCHRVIKGTGEFNNYRWGKFRKVAMIINEAASNR